MTKILFVCTGNICRSPSAEAILKHKLKSLEVNDIVVDSAATHGHHVGEKPDPRALHEGSNRDISFKGITARQVTYGDFDDFDLIFAMDKGHHFSLTKNKPKNSKADVELFLDYIDHNYENEVSDPYYGSDQGFSDMFDLLDEATDMLLKKLALPYEA